MSKPISIECLSAQGPGGKKPPPEPSNDNGSETTEPTPNREEKDNMEKTKDD